MLKRFYVQSISLQDGIRQETGYIRDLPVVKSLQRQSVELTRPVTFFVGENGTGKSTLVEAIAVCMGFNAEGGSRNFRFSTQSTESPLHRYLRIAKSDYPLDGFFLRAESFYNAVSYMDELDQQPAAAPLIKEAYGGDSLHHQSHGESFMALVQHRLRGNGLYILDEPEAALSPSRQLALLSEIHRLVNARSQFIIATHSPLLLAYPRAQIFELTEQGLHETAYEDTDHVRLTRCFMENPQRMLDVLLETGE